MSNNEEEFFDKANRTEQSVKRWPKVKSLFALTFIFGLLGYAYFITRKENPSETSKKIEPVAEVEIHTNTTSTELVTPPTKTQPLPLPRNNLHTAIPDAIVMSINETLPVATSERHRRLYAELAIDRAQHGEQPDLFILRWLFRPNGMAPWLVIGELGEEGKREAWSKYKSNIRKMGIETSDATAFYLDQFEPILRKYPDWNRLRNYAEARGSENTADSLEQWYNERELPSGIIARYVLLDGRVINVRAIARDYPIVVLTDENGKDISVDMAQIKKVIQK